MNIRLPDRECKHDGPVATPTCAAFHRRAEDLAAWAWAWFVNRTDVWGGYRPLEERGKQYRRRDGTVGKLGASTTRPAPSARGRVALTPEVLVRHFRAGGPEDVVGLHTTGPENTSKWGTVEVDWHGPDGAAPQANWAAARGWYD